MVGGMKRIFRIIFLSACVSSMLFGACVRVSAQQDSLQNIVRKFEKFRDHSYQEKLFVHTDRTFYLTGDYLWFKIYSVDGFHHELSNLSKVGYIELLDRNDKPVLQTKIAMNNGEGSSSIFLPASLNSGNYTLRAYTRWMRNFSAEFYFHKTITIVNPFKPLQHEPEASTSQLDVQFFPEGGDLIYGLESRVAFRVVDKTGKGVTCRGWLVDQDYDTLVEFQSLKFGIGSFGLTPQPGKQYRAVIKNQAGTIIGMKEIPSAKEFGSVMHVQEQDNRLLISVTGRFIDDVLKIVHLIVHTRGDVVYSSTKALHQNSTTFAVDKNILRDGISHITLFDENNLPASERLFFKKPLNLTLTGNTDKESYSTRQRVNVNVSAKGSDDGALPHSTSVSIYRLDSLQSPDPVNILNYFYLSADLKGNIESPDYYFSEDKDAKEATDNLMLTHGWRRFQWKDVLSGKEPTHTFIPEFRGHLVVGTVVNEITGDPTGNIPTYLSIPGKYFQFRGAKTSRNGEVRFELKEFYGPNKMIVQTNPQIDSVYKIQITDPFSDQFASTVPPSFRISGNVANELVDRSIGMQLENAFFEQTRAKIVNVKRDTVPFYGKPDEHYRLDDFTRFPVMEDVMREYVPGILVRKRKREFYFLTIDDNTNAVFRENPLVLLDGIPVFRINSIMEYDPLKVSTLDVITHKYHYGPLSFPGLASYRTYNGDYPDFPIDKKALVMDYDGLLWAREFFSPVYETTENMESRVPDFRSLLYWSPSVKMDSNGKSSFSFYTSDQPGEYMVNIQGLAKGGLCGSTSFTFRVGESPSN